MHFVMRFAWLLAILAALTFSASAQTQSEYKQADTRFYPRSALFAADPAAPVVAPNAVTNLGDSYLVTTRGQAPPVVYLQQTHDWIEPITPPSEPASLNIAPTDMQIREPLGSVQVALPTAPGDFHDVERGMTLPNGAVLRTGDNSSVAVLFGGVDSVRLAPNSQAAVQMNLLAGLRDVEVDIRGGMVFSKVGQREGEKQAYAVHTPFGDATAHGTDYVTVVYPRRVDVWVAQGTVTLTPPAGPVQMTVSTGHEPLKVMRYPASKDAAAALAESAESLTALLNFIPMANQKLAALAARTQSGAHLTPTEKDYVGRIRQVVALVKLADVNAPVAPPTPPPRAQLARLPAPAAPSVKPAPKAKAIVQAAPPKAKPALAAASAPPVQAPPAAPKISPNVVLAATPSPAMAKALAEIGETSPKSAAKAEATATASVAPKAQVYQTKPVVIVLPRAHFPKVAPDADGTTALTDKPAKAKKIAKSVTKPDAKHGTPAVAANPAKSNPSDGEHYLRAQPVNPEDLVESPPVQSTPPLAPPPSVPPEKAHASADVDPNSLGAPLGGYPMLAPHAPEPLGTPAVKSTGY